MKDKDILVFDAGDCLYHILYANFGTYFETLWNLTEKLQVLSSRILNSDIELLAF